MTNLIEYAKTELEKLGLGEQNSKDIDDLWNTAMSQDVLELLEVFSRQGHSGSSRSQVLNLFSQLALYSPLSPLNGEDSEWVQVDENLYQNKRASHVFKNDKDEAWDIQGKVFEDKEGHHFTNQSSLTLIQFPYFPKTEYVKYNATIEK
jgi:hypothetical protein